LSALPAGVTVSNLAKAPDNLVGKHLATQADHLDHTFTALNTANVNDGAFVFIPRDKAVEAPIHLLFVSTENALSHPRALILAEENSSATVIESYVSLHEAVSFSNAVTEVVTQADAVLDHYRLQLESESAFHIGTTQVAQARGSRYASYAVSLGAAIARHDMNIKLNDERTETELDGLYVATGEQHCDNHSTIDHAFPHCASKQLYKGILDDKARGVFNGIVYVREGAVQTDAQQLNKNLLLSAHAHVDTKPQLEIFADDVKCAHGATVGQLEDEQLFYLAARGISTERARALLTYGFAEDVISKIKIASVHKALDQAVLNKLHQELEVD
jgi:Fe-S cluster assembly protein SufD